VSKILSQDEIDALLAESGPAGRAPRAAEEAAGQSYAPYNFRRPDRISKDQIHSLHFLHERFARNVSQSLAAYLRSTTDLSLASVEQFAYSEFLMSLADPTAYYALSLAPFEDLGGLEINPAVAFAMVERMLGGTGQATPVDRALTDIEQNVIDSVVKILLDSLTETWKPVVDLAFGIRGRETRPQMLQVASPNDTVLMLVFEMRVGETQGMLNLCLPASIVEKTDTHFAGAFDRQRREPTPRERTWLLENLHVVSDSTRFATGRVVLRHVDGRILTQESSGDGPVDAALKAIEQATGVFVKLRKFEVRSVSSGEDAQGEAVVTCEYNGRSYRGTSVTTDIVESGVRAFIEVINAIESSRRRGADQNETSPPAAAV